MKTQEMNLELYYSEFLQELENVKDVSSLNQLKGKFIGRKGKISELFKTLKDLDPQERKVAGKKLNELKEKISSLLDKKVRELKSKTQPERAVDLSLPGKRNWCGSFHPLTITLKQIIEIFQTLGFRLEEGPEIETEYFNFEALNIPADHPARDEQDSFYLKDNNFLLRTHTSPAQIRVMQKYQPPLKVIVPGKCFRRDAFDATHSPMFHQVEGLVVAEKISMGDLKGTIEIFTKRLFGKERKVRFRPSYFPFTEPSCEVDISCGMCGGEGCRSCGYSGWLEIMGAGLVHPQVLKNGGYDSERFRGFAFGMGVERIAMLKYGIPDIRWFYTNDIRFLDQFKTFR